MNWAVLSLAIACICRVSAAPHEWIVGQAVRTTSGTYKGHASKTKPGVSEYLGMWFGQSTDGVRRFAKPVKYTSFETFEAVKFSDDCPGQLSSLPPGQNAVASMLLQQRNNASENCLSVNVWTKAQSGEKAKAVLVWMYGGGFNIGTSNTPLYDGSHFADDEDVIVVTFNYRLGIFGFPNGPAGLESNLALYDQRLALEWVKENIAGFRGDPKRIVIFGESAGGGSVDMYAYAWASDPDPIIAGIIAESGSAIMKGPISSSMQTRAWFGVTDQLGCGGQTASAAVTLGCMRNKTYLEILNVVRKGSGPNPITSQFMPAPDGKVVFDDYQKRAGAGNFIKVPILVGNNDNEAGFFTMMSAVTGQKTNSTTTKTMNIGFNCPSHFVAMARKALGIPSWRYRYFAAFPNSAMAPKEGAVHGSEIAHVWGTYRSAKATADEISLSKTMKHAWAEFAKDPKAGLTKLGFPIYDPGADTLIRLGYQNLPNASLARGNFYDEGCDAWVKSNQTFRPMP